MSVPATPTARRRPISQASGTDGGENTGTGSWLGAIGGVMGELLNSWGILGALKRRGWGTMGARSTPNTPPQFSRSSSPMHEQIELTHLNIQPRESYEGEGRDRGETRVGSPAAPVPRRPRPGGWRPPRHSFHEGSSPDSYLLTALLVHSLKHGSGKTCQEPHCHLCEGQGVASQSDWKLESNKDLLLDEKQWRKLATSSTSYHRSISEESSTRVEAKPLRHHRSSSSALSSDEGNATTDEGDPPNETTSSSLTHVTSSSLLLSSPSSPSSFPVSETFLSARDSSSISSHDTLLSSSKDTDVTGSLQTDTLTGFMTGRSCGTSSFFADDSYDSATLTGDFELPRDNCMGGYETPSMGVGGGFAPDPSSPSFLSASVCSLPCRLGNEDSLERPLVSSGSLVMVQRRPSLSDPSAASHFRWEEVRVGCGLGGRRFG